ncbi:hypothetical protein IFM89_032703 [Coptis chinensis]|uniref:H15 domain-containing protein n=1 Tax=Coptis chinensis TaxID=261450 RepID=A0A835M254_9MAGN|nr:hypothetical protein IFM89_032703 [Coptis chinensis]
MEIDNHCNNTCYAVELTLLEEERRARHMKKFKDAMLQISMSKNPHRSPDQLVVLEKYIDERLPSVMPSLLCAPDHPPYADMIIIAIRTLGEKRGSKKSSISNFINETYKNLPLQHDLILTRDLQRLVQVGQIVCIYKSRYKFPADSKPNANNQQQDSEKQIVLREVGGLMTKKHSAVVEVADPVDVDLHGLPMVLSEKHPTSLVEVFDPIDVDSAGGMLVDLTEQPLAMIELETVGGDDGGSNPLEAVTGAMKPSEEKLPRHGRNLRKRKCKVEQHKEIVEKSTEIVPSLGTLVNDDVVGHGSKESLPKNHTMAMIEFETIYGDGGGSKPLEAVIGAVKPSEEKLPRYGRNLRKRKSEVEQHEEIIEKSTEIVPSWGTLVNDDDDDDDDVVGHGSKESLKESLLCVTEVFDPVEVDGTGDRLITLPKKHTSGYD